MNSEHSIISQLDVKQQSLALKLCQLPCFSQHEIASIQVVHGGLSQPCFHVNYHHKSYFAKFLNANSIEPLASELAANYSLSPKLTYVGHNWLITEFIVGKGLDQSLQSSAEKLSVLLALLVRCHRIPYVMDNSLDYLGENIALNSAPYCVPKLEIADIINQLFQNTPLSFSQTQSLSALSDLLLQRLANALETESNFQAVFCHGDANFSNVIQRENDAKSVGKLYQLIDFECACIAPVEYDLAMLMAVNGIDDSKVSVIISRYQAALKSSNQQEKPIITIDNSTNNVVNVTSISSVLVMRYLDISLLINSLWYLCQFSSKSKQRYKTLALKQLKVLAIKFPQINSLLDEMR